MMMKRLAIPAVLLALGTGGLSGCVYKEKERVATTPAPSAVVVAQPGQRVYAYREGRYELHGDGTATSPYYWVWIPAGSQAVPPPPLPPVPRS